MTEPSALPPRDRANLRLGREPNDMILDVDELAAAASVELEEEPAGRAVAQSLIAAVVAIAVAVLLVVVLSQGAWLVVSGKLPCLGPGCVQVPLTRIETATGVDFPDGTVVLWSSMSQGLMGDVSMRFEVRIPSGLPVPDPPNVRGNPQPWVSEPNPDNMPSSRAEDFEERGLQDVRWTYGGWAAGVETNGDTIVGGSEHDPA